MPANLLGVSNSNVFINYTAATKMTKWITLSTEITSSSGWTTTRSGTIQFYADSAGIWWTQGRLTIGTGAGGTKVASQSISIAGVTLRTGIDIPVDSVVTEVGVAAFAPVTSRVTTVTAVGYFQILTASANFNLVDISFNVPLDAEPTTYTTAANMEGALPVDVYIPPASAGVAGLVNNVVSNTAGTPILGKTDGAAVAAGYVGENYTDIYTGTHGSTTGTLVNAITRALGAGKWKISAMVCGIAGGITSLNVAILTSVSIAEGSFNYNTSTDGFNNTGAGVAGLTKTLPDIYITVPTGGCNAYAAVESVYSSNGAYRVTLRCTRIA